MDTLTYLGIYPNAIEHAAEVLEAVCKKHEIHSEAVWMNIHSEFNEDFTIDVDFTISLIDMMFNYLRDALLDVGIADDRIYWEANGLYSDFYIDGETAY